MSVGMHFQTLHVPSEHDYHYPSHREIELILLNTSTPVQKNKVSCVARLMAFCCCLFGNDKSGPTICVHGLCFAYAFLSLRNGLQTSRPWLNFHTTTIFQELSYSCRIFHVDFGVVTTSATKWLISI